MSRWASEIDRDLEWREAELASLKHSAISTRMNDTPHRAALRALWSMLYAHFEGFTKFCWDLALDEIEHSKTKREALIDSVAIASLESFFTRLRKDSTSHALWDSFQRHLPEQLLLDAEFPEKYRFSTESNLWPHVFRRETSKLGICCTEIDRYEVFIRALVSRRNEIAHGKKMVIRSLEDYQPYEDAVIAVMYELAIAVSEFLDRREYCKV